MVIEPFIVRVCLSGVNPLIRISMVIRIAILSLLIAVGISIIIYFYIMTGICLMIVIGSDVLSTCIAAYKYLDV